MTARTVYTPAALDILHAQAIEEGAARNAQPDPRQQHIDLLADLAGLLRDHPRLPLPHLDGTGVRFNIFGSHAAEVMTEASLAIPGGWTEESYTTRYGLYVMLRGEWHGTPVTLVTATGVLSGEQVAAMTGAAA